MSEIRFNDGIPERGIVKSEPGEYIARTCGECVRFTQNFHGKPGWHCSNISKNDPITPEMQACDIFWDKAAQEKVERQHEADIESRRKQLWAIYSEKAPVKLEFENDGYGYMPKCPVCGEMPYSTEQCHWCGQHFLQDEEVEKYNDPGPEVRLDCPSCGGEKSLVGHRAKYNGHFHGSCELCGCMVIE